MNGALALSNTSTVTAEQIDELGHMNVRWYGHNATEATKAVCARLGLAELQTLSAYTRHYHEQLERSRLEVHSAVLEGTGRLRLYHELRNAASGELAATFVHEMDHTAIEVPAIPLPDVGRPRSLDLSTDAMASAPSLFELRERDLAIRYEREVTTEDSHGQPVVPPWLGSNLIWGGERPGGDDDWIMTTDDGDRVAFATMESRLWTAEMPAVGTRIQSFGAVVAVGNKITHSLNWAFDLATKQPLAIFEVINLAFSLTERRSVRIPQQLRDAEAARLHPDLKLG